MRKLIEKVFNEYKLKEAEIEPGFITIENIEWLIEKFNMDHMSNKEINDLWMEIDDFLKIWQQSKIIMVM